MRPTRSKQASKEYYEKQEDSLNYIRSHIKIPKTSTAFLPQEVNT